MARIKTGVSKKSNRINLAALSLCYEWRNQFGIGTKMDAQMAWILSDGKFGIEPERDNYLGGYKNVPDSELTVDTFKVARYITVKEEKVA